MTPINRRQFLMRGLFGTGFVGLRALATGLPPAFFLSPRRAMAQAAAAQPQFLILSTSGSGDPLNCNAPGTYDLPSSYPANLVYHPTDASMAPAPVVIGGTRVTAAAPWATMDAQVLDRTAFIHHATMTANHGDQNNVLRLMGAVRRGEMATSVMAEVLATTLGTIQVAPLALASEVIQFQGQYQQRYTPLGIKSLLQGAKSPLSDPNLQMLRDAELKRLNQTLSQSRATRAELAFMNNLASSQDQIRHMSEAFATDLQAITTNGQDDQCTMAVLLAKLKVAPIFTVHIDFGGDNHSDVNLAGETASTVAGVASINKLMATLKNYQMEDQVTFATLNVFGRTLGQQATPGRGHNGGHHVTVAIGSKIQGGVFGGVSPTGMCMNIDPATGNGVSNGGIAMGDSLSSVGKTLSRALGVDPVTFDEQLTDGQVITGVLR